NLASHLRSLIKPAPGYAVAYLDYEQQEFGIAAFLSSDTNMMNAYRSGDAYLAFARQAGAIPSDATEEQRDQIRGLFKTCALGTNYGMGAWTLSDRIGGSLSKARELLRLSRELYPHYWRWSDACVEYAMLYGYLTTPFGWCVHVDSDTKPTS